MQDWFTLRQAQRTVRGLVGVEIRSAYWIDIVVKHD